MLTAIVVDRPLAEAQTSVDRPRQFLEETKKSFTTTKRIPVSSKCYGPSKETLRRMRQAAVVAKDAGRTGDFSDQFHEKLRPPGGESSDFAQLLFFCISLRRLREFA